MFAVPANVYHANYTTSYCVSPDDERFLMMRFVQAQQASEVEPTLVLVRNWFEELRAKLRN